MIPFTIGVATGLFSGLLGIGGGFVLVPAMTTVLRVPQREANGTSLVVILPVALVGALILGKSHEIDSAIALALAAGSVAGAAYGARLTQRLSETNLRRAFGLLAVVIGLVMVGNAVLAALHLALPLGTGTRPTGLTLWVTGIIVGGVAGVGSGLFGIGGGAIMIPAMVLLMALTQHAAQGTSLAVILPTALVGAFIHFRQGNIRPGRAAWVSAGGVLGAVAGAVVAVATSDQALRLLFGVYLWITGVAMLQGTGRPVSSPTMEGR